MHVCLQTKESMQRYNEARRRVEETERELVEMEQRAQDGATQLVQTKQQLRWTQRQHISQSESLKLCVICVYDVIGTKQNCENNENFEKVYQHFFRLPLFRIKGSTVWVSIKFCLS